jgi:two-component system response regulator NreC
VETKILIVDDYSIFRRGLKLLLEKHSNFKVVGEALNFDDLFDLLKKVKPDVIVMDLMLPQKTVIKISKKLSREYPEIPFLIITVSAIEYTIMECIINGARGIVWKESSPEDLINAINTVASGERYFEIPESRMVTQVFQHMQNSLHDKNDFTEISEREQEVLTYFAKGYSYKQIGEKLSISPRTVESHKNNILSKLNLHSTAELIKYAIKHNLIELN